MQQNLNLQIEGLYTNPNQFSAAPVGALQVATNVVINRKNIIETRNGQKNYGPILSVGSGVINQFCDYNGTLITHYDNKLAYDLNNAGTTWQPYSGTYVAPTGYKLRHIESNNNLYFTSTQGIWKLDTISATPITAGAPKGLNIAGSTTGASGFLPDQDGVAYRVVWGYTDANDNLILGSPSQREIVTNTAGADRNVSLTFQIPAGVTTSWIYQIYRSGAATLPTTPNDELQLVEQKSPTSAEITAKSVTLTDSTPDDLRGAALYTNDSQQTILQSNDQPPLAVDIALYQNRLFYANTVQRNVLLFDLISVGGTDGVGYASSTGATFGLGDVIITGIASTTGMRIGQRVVALGIPAAAKIVSVDSGTQITVSLAATSGGAGVAIETNDVVTIGGQEYYADSAQNTANREFFADTSGSPSENIQSTALSLIATVNGNTANTTIYGYYISNYDQLPGKMQFQERSVGGAVFYATSNQGGAFTPTLPSSGTTVASTNDGKQNRVYYSKLQQPEAVPSLNYLDVGSEGSPIYRIVTLRDSVFVFKGDGIYRITSASPPFSVSLVDSTTIVLAPESVQATSAYIFCMTTLGVVAVSDSGGTEIISEPINDILNLLSSSQYTYFQTATFGIAYDSEKAYVLYTVSDEDDVYSTQAFYYNYIYKTWTRWTGNKNCGIVLSRDRKLYLGDWTTDYVQQERKNNTRTDFADEEYPVTIVSYSDDDIVLSSVTVVEVGYTIVQGVREAIVTAVDTFTNTITVNQTFNWVAGAAIVYKPISTEIVFIPQHCGNVGIIKHFQEIAYVFEDASFSEIDMTFSTDLSKAVEISTQPATSDGGWGTFPWGLRPWGGSVGGEQLIRTWIPRNKSRAHYINIGMRLSQAFTSLTLQGISLIYVPVSTRFKGGGN